MKQLLHPTTLATLTLALALPTLALAQQGDAAKKPAASKTSAKTNAKPSAKPVAKKAEPNANRVRLKSAAVNAAAGIRAAEAALTPDELAIAEGVYTGNMPCELGNSVTVTRDPARPGFGDVHTRNHKFRMSPVATPTGAVRLEDKTAGAVWLQILNKSMLMNHKIGQRLADECVSAEQRVIAEGLKNNPPPSVLDGTPSPKK